MVRKSFIITLVGVVLFGALVAVTVSKRNSDSFALIGSTSSSVITCTPNPTGSAPSGPSFTRTPGGFLQSAPGFGNCALVGKANADIVAGHPVTDNAFRRFEIRLRNVGVYNPGGGTTASEDSNRLINIANDRMIAESEGDTADTAAIALSGTGIHSGMHLTQPWSSFVRDRIIRILFRGGAVIIIVKLSGDRSHVFTVVGATASPHSGRGDARVKLRDPDRPDVPFDAVISHGRITYTTHGEYYGRPVVGWGAVN